MLVLLKIPVGSQFHFQLSPRQSVYSLQVRLVTESNTLLCLKQLFAEVQSHFFLIR